MKTSFVAIPVLVVLLLISSCTGVSRDYIDEGDRYSSEKNWDKAIESYEKALKQDPSQMEVVQRLAVAHNNRGWQDNEIEKWDTAIESFTTAIDLSPDFSEAFNNRGRAYHGKGQIDLAAALEHDEKGENKLANEDYDTATQWFTLAINDLHMAIRLKPNFPEARENIADAYNDRGRVYDELQAWILAINDLNYAIRYNDMLAEAYNNRGWAYNAIGKVDNAISDLDKATELDPAMALAFSNRSWSYFQKEEWDQSIRDATSAIQLEPDLALAYLNRGYSHFMKGMRAEAKADFDKVIELTTNPELLDAANKGLLSLGELQG